MECPIVFRTAPRAVRNRAEPVRAAQPANRPAPAWRGNDRAARIPPDSAEAPNPFTGRLRISHRQFRAHFANRPNRASSIDHNPSTSPNDPYRILSGAVSTDERTQ